jgi:TM2 domain-containing membrane protein YozV
MFCRDCGTEMQSQSVFCQKCGKTVNFNYCNLPIVKSRVLFIVLALLLGQFGVHNFYAGYNVRGIWQLAITIFLFWMVIPPILVWIWAIIEAIIVKKDSDGLLMK